MQVRCRSLVVTLEAIARARRFVSIGPTPRWARPFFFLPWRLIQQQDKTRWMSCCQARELLYGIAGLDPCAATKFAIVFGVVSKSMLAF